MPSREASQSKDRTQVSRISGRFFTLWATREAQEYLKSSLSLLQGIFLTQESTGVSYIIGRFFTSWAKHTHTHTHEHAHISIQISKTQLNIKNIIEASERMCFEGE